MMLSGGVMMVGRRMTTLRGEQKLSRWGFRGIFHERFHRIAMVGLKGVMEFMLKKRFPYCAAVGWMYVASHPFCFDKASGWIMPKHAVPWRSWTTY